MQLTIRKVPKHIKLKTIRTVAHFCANELLSPQLSKNIELAVIFDHDECGKAYGRIQSIDNFLPVRDFIIWLDPRRDLSDIIKTIAHEMRHLEQLATERWFWYWSKPKMRWKSRIYRYDPDTVCHTSKPWEIEAYDGEKKLLDKLKNMIDQQPSGKFSRKFLKQLRKGIS